MKFETNKYLTNWACYYVLQSIAGIYYYYYLFISASWHPALRGNGFVREFGFSLYWAFFPQSLTFLYQFYFQMLAFSSLLLPTLRYYGLLTSHTLEKARSPCHIIEVLWLAYYTFFTYILFYFFFFIFSFWIWFSFGPKCTQKLPKLLKANLIAFFLFFILLFLPPQLVSISNKALQPREIRQNLQISMIHVDQVIISPAVIS